MLIYTRYTYLVFLSNMSSETSDSTSSESSDMDRFRVSAVTFLSNQRSPLATVRRGVLTGLMSCSSVISSRASANLFSFAPKLFEFLFLFTSLPISTSYSCRLLGVLRVSYASANLYNVHVNTNLIIYRLTWDRLTDDTNFTAYLP